MRQLDPSIFTFVRPAVILAQLVGLGALASACAPGALDDPKKSETAEPAPKVAKASQAIAGIDSNVTISAASQQVNRYTTLASNAPQSATSIVVGSVAALAVGADALSTG